MPPPVPLAVLYQGTPWQAVTLVERPRDPADAWQRLSPNHGEQIVLAAQPRPPGEGDHLTLHGQVLRYRQGLLQQVGAPGLLGLTLHTVVAVRAPPAAWPQVQEALRTYPGAQAFPHGGQVLLVRCFSLTLGPDLHLVLTALRTRQERQLARLLGGLQLLDVQGDPGQIESQLDLASP